MNSVFDIVLPVFGILMLGYVAARAGAFDESANRGLSLFVFTFSLPLLLFQAIATANLPSDIPWSFLVAYYGGTFMAMALAMSIGRFMFGRRLDEQGVVALGGGFSNVSMLGIPLIIASFGQQAALPLFILLSVHALTLLPVITAIIEAGRGRNQRFHLVLLSIGRGLATNPIILGLAAGLTCNLTGLVLPGNVLAITKSLGGAAVPCSLFVLGASIARYRIAGNVAEPLMLVAIKNVVHPAIVWLLATQVFELPKLWSLVAVTLAALPTGVTAYLFAQRYQTCVANTATTILISTGFSALTLSALVYLLAIT